MKKDGGIPITRVPVSAERATRIRSKVRATRSMPVDVGTARIAHVDDAELFLGFLSDPAVHAPIYTLPRPLTLATVREFIEKHMIEQQAGEGMLFLCFDGAGNIVSYNNIGVWPQWAAGKMGGAVHPERQGTGSGTRGAAAGFGWMFDVLDLEIICETAALDNVRSARLLDKLGFDRVGQITSYRDDGTSRPSLVWEMTRSSWRDRYKS